MLSPIPRRGGWDRRFCSCSPNHGSLPRKRGRVGPRIVLFEACSAFTSRYGLHTRHVTVFRDAFVTRGFNRFVTSTVAPVASGWSILAGWDSHPLESAALARRTLESGRRTFAQIPSAAGLADLPITVSLTKVRE